MKIKVFTTFIGVSLFTLVALLITSKDQGIQDSENNLVTDGLQQSSPDSYKKSLKGGDNLEVYLAQEVTFDFEHLDTTYLSQETEYDLYAVDELTENEFKEKLGTDFIAEKLSYYEDDIAEVSEEEFSAFLGGYDDSKDLSYSESDLVNFDCHYEESSDEEIYQTLCSSNTI